MDHYCTHRIIHLYQPSLTTEVLSVTRSSSLEFAVRNAQNAPEEWPAWDGSSAGDGWHGASWHSTELTTAGKGSHYSRWLMVVVRCGANTG